MVKRICQKLLIIIYSLLFFNWVACSNRDSDWVLEWEFKNTSGLNIYSGFQTFIKIDENSYGWNHYVDSLGRLLAPFGMYGTVEDVYERNPILRCIISNQSDTVFDTSMSWDGLDFREQYSIYDNRVMKNVSKKTFLIQDSVAKIWE